MIVLVVHYIGVSVLETKRYAPVPVYRDGPCSPAITREFVQAEAGQVHVFDERRGVEPTKDEPETFGVRGLDACSITRREERGQSFVLETAYYQLWCNL